MDRSANSPAEGSSSPVSTPVRDAIVAFLSGARNGFREKDLATWCRRHLLARGLLRPKDALSGRIVLVEADAGKLEIPTVALSADRDREDAVKIAEFARRRTVEMVRLLAQTPPDDRFLNAAIQSGRVARTQVSGTRRTTWTPQLKEGDSLSYMLVSLVAADALENRDVYERYLRICRICGDIGFDADVTGRAGCADHPIITSRPAPRPSSPDASGEPVPQRSSGIRPRQHSASALTEPAMKAVKAEK